MRKDEVRNKKNISRGLLRALALTAALALMLMALAGCKAEETTLQNLLPRENVTEAAVGCDTPPGARSLRSFAICSTARSPCKWRSRPIIRRS